MPLSAFKYTNNIKKLCRSKGWTANDLRDRVGNSPPMSTVFKWFRQERQPGRKYLDRLLIVFNCTIYDLLNIDGNK